MKKIILLSTIITLTLNGYDIYTHTESYIIDKIEINKLPICPNKKISLHQISIEIYNKIYTKKTTSLILCRTKQNKIKLTIKKEIKDKKEWKSYKK